MEISILALLVLCVIGIAAVVLYYFLYRRRINKAVLDENFEGKSYMSPQKFVITILIAVLIVFAGIMLFEMLGQKAEEQTADGAPPAAR